MLLDRFFLISLIIHILFSFFIIANFNSANQKKEKKYTNVINSEIIGFIDQNSLKTTEILPKNDLDSKKDEENVKNLEKMKDFNFGQVEDFLNSSLENSKKEQNLQDTEDEQKNKENNNHEKPLKILKNTEDEQKNKENNNHEKPLKILKDKKEENKTKKDNSANLAKEKKDKVKKIDQEKIKDIKKNQINKNISNKKPGVPNKNLQTSNELDQKTVKNLKDQLQKAEKTFNSQGQAKKQNLNSSENFGPQSMASLGAYIKAKIVQCWKIPMTIGLISDQKIYVILRIKLNKNGEIFDFKVLNNSQYIHNEFFEKIKQSAIEAIQQCSPILGLPIEKYENWEEVELIFDPSKI